MARWKKIGEKSKLQTSIPKMVTLKVPSFLNMHALKIISIVVQLATGIKNGIETELIIYRKIIPSER